MAATKNPADRRRRYAPRPVTDRTIPALLNCMADPAVHDLVERFAQARDIAKGVCAARMLAALAKRPALAEQLLDEAAS